MVKPVRIQLSRRKGFNLQEHSIAMNGLTAINVARPTKFGNPFTKEKSIASGYGSEANWRELVVECFSEWLSTSQQGRDWWQGPESDKRRSAILSGLSDLRGKNLACWCPLPEPGKPDHCHASVLLRLANS